MLLATGSEISVIVPCLNEEKALPLFLNSLVENQNFIVLLGCSAYWIYELTKLPFDLIIVDGGSTDRSRDLIDKYRHKIPITGLIEETRNLGVVRNRGAVAARGTILFHTNSDTILPRNTMLWICQEFQDPKLIALSARTVPLNGGAMSTAAYAAFDFLRWFFNKIGVFSPSCNFLAVRSSAFHDVGGFNRLRINEDGELGERLVKYARQRGLHTKFRLDLHVWHHVKRWGSPLRALRFYAYVFGNFNPMLKRILKPIERKSAHDF